MKQKIVRTTHRQFLTFKRECEKWINHFGMHGHKFYFQHQDLENANAFAYCLHPYEPEDRLFTLGLSKTTNDTATNEDIKRSAFHEVMEALTANLRYLAVTRFITQQAVDHEIHNIIRTLEQGVWKNMQIKRQRGV